MFEMKQGLVVRPETAFVPADAAATTALVAPKLRPGARDPSVDHRLGPTAVWRPASSSRIQVVEGIVLLATMAYFAYGLGAVLGVF